MWYDRQASAESPAADSRWAGFDFLTTTGTQICVLVDPIRGNHVLPLFFWRSDAKSKCFRRKCNAKPRPPLDGAVRLQMSVLIHSTATASEPSLSGTLCLCRDRRRQAGIALTCDVTPLKITSGSTLSSPSTFMATLSNSTSANVELKVMVLRTRKRVYSSQTMGLLVMVREVTVVSSTAARSAQDATL